MQAEPEHPLDEIELVARAKKRDPAAAEELVRRYHEKAYAVAYRRCSGDAEEAKDLTQEAFLRAFRRIDQFKGTASFYTWLYRIVVNTCLDGVRRQKKRWSLFSSWKSEEGESETGRLEGNADPSPESDPAAELRGRELRTRVQSALGGLSTGQRMVFELKVFDEMSIPEIAKGLNIAEGTVKSHLFRATQHVRKALNEWAER